MTTRLSGTSSRCVGRRSGDSVLLYPRGCASPNIADAVAGPAAALRSDHHAVRGGGVLVVHHAPDCRPAAASIGSDRSQQKGLAAAPAHSERLELGRPGDAGHARWGTAVSVNGMVGAISTPARRPG